MLRIHFTPHDLQNVRVARQPDPLWELICGVCRLETGQGPLEFGHWRRSARARIAADPAAAHALGPVRQLIPAAGYIPDFLTPPVTGEGLSAGLELVRGTPRPRLVRELTRLAESRPVPAWTTTLGRPGARDGLGLLTQALARSFRTLLEPYWPQIRSAVADDVALRGRTLLDGGTQALLDGLRPLAHWRAPVLEVDYPVRRELHLEGRGLLLVPSFFCWRRPTALADPGLDPVLVYPVAKIPPAAARTGGDGLEKLLGRTRATVLTAVAGPGARSSSEVAEAVGISLPSVSYQIGVLRDGGLVASHRDGKYVLHTATPLGRRLITGSGGRPRPGAATGPWHDRGHV
ncbi:helix-turn-helix domain-containing protein [Streptomyces sp. NPDC059786]|uniref:helix-turn-helix domain-containing protein n=1 Tax=Streptomyces sp. NPDC059786 TaxID=3346946 RepID=UPI003646D427